MIMGQNDHKPFSWFTDEAGVYKFAEEENIKE